MKTRRLMTLTTAVLTICGAAAGQSLFQQPVAAPPARGVGQPATESGDPASQPANGGEQGQSPAPQSPAPAVTRAPAQVPIALAEVSLMSVKPAKPTEYAEHDLVTIIISERSKMDRSQEAESSKEYDNSFSVQEFMDLINLLETRVEKTSDARLPGFGVTSENEFEGEGSYKREDRFTDRITARVVEIKPNGTLLLEARRQFKTDEEETVVLLSGVCRVEDITSANTIQSNQLFDLVMDVQNSGDLQRSTRKGLIPRILEGLLNF